MNCSDVMNRADIIRQSIETLGLLLNAAGIHYTAQGSWVFLGHNKNGLKSNIFIDGTDIGLYGFEISDGPGNRLLHLPLESIVDEIENWRAP